MSIWRVLVKDTDLIFNSQSKACSRKEETTGHFPKRAQCAQGRWGNMKHKGATVGFTDGG